MRVLVAGATGAVGRQLVPALVRAGHQVTATSRSEARLAGLRAAGAQLAVLDGLDAQAVGEVVARAEPEVIIHEMTAIPADLSLRNFDRSFAVTNQLRTRGIDYLLAAAAAAGARRVIAQSYGGWDYARTGGLVKTEDDPLDPQPPARQRETLAAIRHLERAVLDAPLEGVVLRYGSLYGPGASEGTVELIRKRQLPVIGSGAGVWSFLHVADAAAATVAAVSSGDPGVYNVADNDPAAVARWVPEVARIVGAPVPRRLPAWVGRLVVGEVGISMMTQIRGVSSARAQRELGWQPIWPSWRDGFARGLASPDQASPDQASQDRAGRTAGSGTRDRGN
jgi:nucleoside-diphosphate-sugar epimerase